MRGVELISAGSLLVLLGLVLVSAGIVLQSLRGAEPEGAEVRGGGVVLIGPFPIVFGTDTGAVKAVLLLTLALIITIYALFHRG